MGWILAGLLVTVLPLCARAQGLPPSHNGFGLVLEAAGEFGGDNVVKVFYTDGSSQNIRAGQGATVSAGVHYKIPDVPLDIAATAGYKFIRTSDYHTDLGIDRIVLKITGTYALPRGFWVDAGPVWHTDVKLNGDGYVPDVNFDDAVGVTIGAGWRWFGISYTNIHYNSDLTGRVDASNVGVTATWKF
jgi:hypothetical protein